MPEVDQTTYWHLQHPDGRKISIGRRPGDYGLNVIAWTERLNGEEIRNGAIDIGDLCPITPDDTITELLNRFRGEGYELVEIITPQTTTGGSR